MQGKQIIAGGFVALAVIIAAFFLFGGDETPEGPAAGAGQPVSVTVTPVVKRAVTFTEELPGRTSAYKVAEIRPQVSGIIEARLFEEGENVTAGQQLYQIDPATYEATHQSAKAVLQRAEANVKSIKSRAERYAELVEIDAVSKQEYDDIQASLAQAQADIAVAQAEVAQAKINVDYTKVYAPISGRIGKSSVTEGALVTASQPEILTKITQLDPIYVDLTQSSTELMALRRQLGEVDELPVTLTLEDGMAYDHTGTLQFSDITVDETTGSVQLRALFRNPERLLLPGLFVHAQLVFGQQEALLVPQKATVRDNQGNLRVWRLADDSTVQPQPISTLRAYGDQWIVTDGVKAGDRVVMEGFQKIAPGAPVTPVYAPVAVDEIAVPEMADTTKADALEVPLEVPAGEEPGYPSETMEAAPEAEPPAGTVEE